jgi:GGDEF domain-containing protein
MVFRDVSEARAMRLKMTYLAQHDFLTDLPNRLLLNDRITQAISLARRHGQTPCSAVFGFGWLQTHQRFPGTSIGDKLLQWLQNAWLLACVLRHRKPPRWG